MAARIRKGDLVYVRRGDERGKRGRVLRVLADEQRVVIEGLNLVFKHLRKSQQNPQGGRVRREAAIHMSNVMPIDPSTDKPTRVSYQVVDGRHVRVARRSRTVLEASGSRKAGRSKDAPATKAAGKPSGKKGE